MSPVIEDVSQDTGDWILSPGGSAVPGTIIGQILDPASPEGKAAQRIYDLDLCRKCGERKGTIEWGDSLAMTHGFSSLRCGVCVYGAELDHAWNRTLALPTIAFRFAQAIVGGWLR